MQTKNWVFRICKIIIVFIIGLLIILPLFYGNSLLAVHAKEGLARVTQSAGCRPGTGWVWVTGPDRPQIAHQAELALNREGVKGTVSASGFGEKDSCGNFELFATDFRVTVEGASNLPPREREALSSKIIAILANFQAPNPGNILIIFGPGITSFHRGSAKTENTVATAEFPMVANALYNKNVYLLVYNPVLSNGQDFNTYMGWTPYSELVQGIIDSFEISSHGQVQYNIAYTHVADQWPIKIDGFRYTEDQYISDYQNNTPHQPIDVDYDAIISDPALDICGKLNRGEIDDLWIYGGPLDGFYESRLVGPGGYWFNSPPMEQTHGCNKLLPIMGLNFERGVPEAVHSFGHRAESTMTEVYGSWEENRTAHNWDRFALVKFQSPNYSYSGCGSIHYPPNGIQDYDYSNPDTALTNCEDFLNYPNLSDPQLVAQSVTCTSWNCNELDYLTYWYSHVPAVSGCTNAVSNNWWEYLTNPNLALIPSSSCSPPPCPTITDWKGEYWTNTSLFGAPAICRNDLNLNFAWGLGSPDPILPSDRFSARWTRTVLFETGLYRFHIDHDDGARLYIDDVLVPGGDFWDTCCVWDSVDKQLQAGNHTIRLEMFESGGAANVELWWEELPSLTINRNGTGNGTVTSDPIGISCGSDCSESYPNGTEVTLTATAASGSTFMGWSGAGCTGTGTCVVTVTASTSITANFDLAPANTIFNDSFESGNLSAWSPCMIDAGDLSASAAAKLVGNFGMQALLDDNVAIYCTSDHPTAETRYVASFYFDPNSITMVNGDTHTIFGGYMGTSTLVLRLQFRRSSSLYQVQAAILNDGSTFTPGGWVTIGDAPHQIKLDWRAATAAGANNGALTMWIDGAQQSNLTGMDNDTRRIDRVRLGAVAAIDTGTRGTYYFDAFTSNRGDGGPTPTATLTVNKTGTGSGTVTSNPAGINCGSTCSADFNIDTVVTLTATADAGSTFTGWSGGGCSGIGMCQVTLAADTTVTANFDLQTSSHTLVVNKTGTGSGTVTSNPAGINCGADCSEAYLTSTSVTLTATTAAGSTFTGWSGGGCSGTGTCIVTMASDTSVTANFNLVSSDLIFKDDFEGCNLSAWSSSTTDAGDLSAGAPGLVGNCSMRGLLDDNVLIYVTSDHPNAEPRYRARFYFDPNSITMVNGDLHRIFYGYSGATKVVLRLDFRRSNNLYQLRAGILTDGSAWRNSTWFTITDGPHSIEIDWRAATSAGANNGILTFWIDGVQKANLTAVDNDTWRIDRVRLGAVNGIDTGTRGTYYFDAFESRRQTYIGP